MMTDINFFILLAGLGIALSATSLGCFVVWRKMAYFGDAISHSALLGVALGFFLSGLEAHQDEEHAGHAEHAEHAGHGASLDIAFEQHLGILLVAFAFAALLIWLNTRKTLSLDVLLGILSHAALAVGLIAMSFLGGAEFDFHDILLGKIDKINAQDLFLIYATAAVILGVLYWQRRALMLITLSEDIARAEGFRVFSLNLLFMALMALFVMVAAQLIGILLIASFLIIPAASARQLARGYRQMVILSWILGSAAVFIGFGLSALFVLPIGAAIVFASVLIFALLLPFTRKITL